MRDTLLNLFVFALGLHAGAFVTFLILRRIHMSALSDLQSAVSDQNPLVSANTSNAAAVAALVAAGNNDAAIAAATATILANNTTLAANNAQLAALVPAPTPPAA